MLVALLGAAAGLYAWAHAYAPLSVVGDGPAHGVVTIHEPALGSEGKRVFVVRPDNGRWAEAHYTLANDGLWPITIERLVVPPHAPNGPAVFPVSLRRPAGARSDRRWDFATAPFTATRLGRHQLVDVFVRYRLNCRGAVHGSSSSDSTLELRYRYLGHFTHSQTLDLPAALTILC